VCSVIYLTPGNKKTPRERGLVLLVPESRNPPDGGLYSYGLTPYLALKSPSIFTQALPMKHYSSWAFDFSL
ncbi:hypothetical protein, partial [Acinetobacter baumannii]